MEILEQLLLVIAGWLLATVGTELLKSVNNLRIERSWEKTLSELPALVVDSVGGIIYTPSKSELSLRYILTHKGELVRYNKTMSYISNHFNPALGGVAEIRIKQGNEEFRHTLGLEYLIKPYARGADFPPNWYKLSIKEMKEYAYRKGITDEDPFARNIST